MTSRLTAGVEPPGAYVSTEAAVAVVVLKPIDGLVALRGEDATARGFGSASRRATLIGGSPLAGVAVIADPVGPVDRDLGRAPAVLLLLLAACSSEAPAPTAPPQPPVVASISAPTATPVPPAAASTPAPVATAIAEPSGAASAPEPRPQQSIQLDRWRAAIENYDPSVRVGNTTTLNAARVPFATYLVAVHNRIHPVFAEQFLAFLNGLPKGHVLNQDLVTHLEIVLDKDTGKLVRMGVTKASGVTAFDLVALTAVDRAAPFGKAPDVIASPDGKVYLHWEFHRDPIDACTTRNARPYILIHAP